MRRAGGNWKWLLLALGVAVVHFMGEFVSLFANLVRAATPEPDNWQWAAWRKLFRPLSFPVVWLFRSPWFEARIGSLPFDPLWLLAGNSLLWGGGIALLLRWLVAKRRKGRQTQGIL